jgi:uncharacterized protein (DUF2132 family)
LHGITLEVLVSQLIEQQGWAELGHRLPSRRFLHNRTIKSSLTLFRKSPWARKRVEERLIAEST